MQGKTVCLRVPKQQGQTVLKLAHKMKIVNSKMKIQRDEHFIFIPLTGQPPEEVLATLKQQVMGWEICNRPFPEKERPLSLLELLGDRLPPDLLAKVPRATDFVGDMAIVDIPPELKTYETVVGKAILKANVNVHTVFAKAGAVSGEYRLREYRVIAGEPRTKTIHKENGCQFYVDVAKAYFSPRLSHEHNRVASLVKEGETVIDLFTGVGPFAIQIAKTHEQTKVYAIDANPDAVEYLKRNVRLNRVDTKVHPILGDARQVVNERLSGVADRVIMNLPEKASEFVDTSCKAIRPEGGTVHFYVFVNNVDSIESVKLSFVETVERSGRHVRKALSSRLVRETAPFEWQVVLDAKIH